MSSHLYILNLIWNVSNKDLCLLLHTLLLLIGHILNPVCCFLIPIKTKNNNIHSVCSHAEINPFIFFSFPLFPIKLTRNLFLCLSVFLSFFLSFFLFPSVAFLQDLAMTPRSSPICHRVFQNGLMTCSVVWNGEST